MRKIVAIAVGALLFAIGAVWTLQGLGYLKGSSMTGSSIWAIVGPIIAAAGVALIYVAARGTRQQGPGQQGSQKQGVQNRRPQKRS